MVHLTKSQSIFTKLGVRPIINACGIYTDLGGSILSPGVWAAMEEINASFISMSDLLTESGMVIAAMVGAEAARVTPGASAAITLGVAACMAGRDGSNWERLPNTLGMRDEVIIQRNHRYKYDRMISIAGAKLIEAGGEYGTSLDQLAAAITPQTAAIMIPAHLDGLRGTVSLQEVTHLARQHGITTLVDAAYLNYPTSIMATFTAQGADLVCFSAKYFWGPNSGGFICGKKELVDIVAGVDFTGYEGGVYRTFGRPFKLDRTTVVGTVVALQEWLTMDHSSRWHHYTQQAESFIRRLGAQSATTCTPMFFTMDERLEAEPVNCVVLDFDTPHLTASMVASDLAAGEPCIRAFVAGDRLVIVMETLREGEELVIADRIGSILRSSSNHAGRDFPA